MSDASRTWGFGVVLFVALGWLVRVDVLLPIVSAHEKFLNHAMDTQDQILEEIKEMNDLMRTAIRGGQVARIKD